MRRESISKGKAIGALGRSLTRLLALTALATTALLAFAASPASAALQYPFISSLSGAGSFDSDPVSVAVNDFNGDTYVADESPSANKVYVFDSSGNLVQTLDGSTTPEGSFGHSFGTGGNFSVAADNATGEVYVEWTDPNTGAGVVQKFASTGTFLCEITGAGSATGTTVSASECDSSTLGTPNGSLGQAGDVAVDQTTGSVYVADQGHSAVDEFSAAGGWLSQINGSATASGSFFNIASGGVAVDPTTGHVFIADAAVGLVYEYDTAGNLLATWDGSAAQNPPGAPTGAFSSSLQVAVDNGSGAVYVADDAHDVVNSFDSAGNYVAQITGTPVAPFASVAGVGVDQAGGDVSVSDPGASVVDLFAGTPVVVPDVSTGEASNVTPTSATLNGTVNPDGTTIIGCHFDYGPTIAYGQTAPCASTPSGSSPVTVSADVAGLTAGVTYHFRLVAANGDGNNKGADSVFGAPLVDGQSSSNVAQTSASLSAQVNPNAEDTTCVFEYVDHAHYDPTQQDPYSQGQSVPCNPADLGLGTTDQAAGADLSGLQPGVTYHWRVLATNGSGTTGGPDQTFQTVSAAQIDSVSVSDLTPTSATLNAQINPLGNDTSCQFQWGTDTSYGTTVACNPADLGSGNSEVAVSQQLTGLVANTTYHFRVAATNSVGTAYSGDHTFAYTTAGGALPDGRGYEMVSPVQKNATRLDIGEIPSVSADGERVMVHSVSCLAGATGCTADRQNPGSPDLFTRSSSGWVTNPLALPAASVSGATDLNGTADAGAALMSAGTPPAGEDDFYVGRAGGQVVHFGPVYPPAAGALGANRECAAWWSADFSHLVYTECPEASESSLYWPFDSTQPGFPATYEYAAAGQSQPQLVGVSGGAGSTDLISACGTTVGGPNVTPFPPPGLISADGRTVFFTALGADDNAQTGSCTGTEPPSDQLWARIDGASSVLLSGRSPADCTTQACLASTPKDAAFVGASDDGTNAFFISGQQLTDSATQGSANLYQYDFSAPAGHELVDVSAGDSSGQGPGAATVSAVSADGSHVYFVASGVLSAAANSAGDFAEPGANNLYVYEHDPRYPGGHVAFVAALSQTDAELAGTQNPPLAAQGSSVANVTPDGRFLVFLSHKQLTADDTSQTGAAQVFRYDAQAGRLTRMSIGAAGFGDNGNGGGSSLCAGQPFSCTADAGIWPVLMPDRRGPSLSDNGARVFFESPIGLTPQALNLVQIGTAPVGQSTGAPVYAENVYEWEQAGVGSCPADRQAGCVYLISDGQDTTRFQTVSDVLLLGTDSTGDNVFFTTVDSLVPQDTDTEFDIYDARVGGGFPFTPPPSPCSGDNCKTPDATPPDIGPGGSDTSSGPGNPALSRQQPAPRRCKKHHKKCKKSRRSSARAADTTRRTRR